MTQFTIRTGTDGIVAEQLRGFFVGWPQHPNPATHLRLLRGSHAVALAVADDKVIGFANAVSDGVLAAYIPLLEVLPDWQGRGIGRQLIAALMEQLSDLYMIDLVCDPDLEAFYAPLGFRALKGMAHRNYENQTGAPDND